MKNVLRKMCYKFQMYVELTGFSINECWTFPDKEMTNYTIFITITIDFSSVCCSLFNKIHIGETPRLNFEIAHLVVAPWWCKNGLIWMISYVLLFVAIFILFSSFFYGYGGLLERDFLLFFSPHIPDSE